MLHLVLVNLSRNPRRAILTTLAIAVSIFVMSVLLSLPAIADRIREAVPLKCLVTDKIAQLLWQSPREFGRKSRICPSSAEGWRGRAQAVLYSNVNIVPPVTRRPWR